jgi:LacI family transcriptional regulator
LNLATRHLVAPAVAARIQSIAEEVGYRADPLAAGLRTRRSRMAAWVAPNLGDPLLAPLLSGLEAGLAERGYATLLARADRDNPHRLAVVESLIARRVEGLFLTDASPDDPILTRCAEADVAIVLVNCNETDGCPAIMPDYGQGSRMAIEHLAALGHSRIAFLGSPIHLPTSKMRLHGYVSAVRAAKLARGPTVFAADLSPGAGRIAAAKLFDDPGFTAIVAAADSLAFGAIQEFAARGLDCPSDISIVGQDDLGLGLLVAPELTSIRFCHADLGRRAVDLLFEQIESRRDTFRTERMSPVLFVRKSTAHASVRASSHERRL